MNKKKQRGRKPGIDDAGIKWLKENYCDDIRTSKEIADELNSNPRTVQYYAQKFNLKKSVAARSIIAAQNVMQRYV